MNGDAHFTEVFLDDARVPDADRIGAVGDGWRVALTCSVVRTGCATAAGGTGGLLDVDRLVALARARGLERRSVIRDAARAASSIETRVMRYTARAGTRHGARRSARSRRARG